jgi:acyl-CoA thioester hydrolase
MVQFRFLYPVEVRYGDLDPQGHVNNTKHLTYLEQARVQYLRHLGLWEGTSFLDIGIILAETQITYHTPILFTNQVQVGVKVTRLGNKSLEMVYALTDSSTSQEFATASTVSVAYDYRTQQTIRIPDTWRNAIRDYEGL